MIVVTFWTGLVFDWPRASLATFPTVRAVVWCCGHSGHCPKSHTSFTNDSMIQVRLHGHTLDIPRLNRFKLFRYQQHWTTFPDDIIQRSARLLIQAAQKRRAKMFLSKIFFASLEIYLCNFILSFGKKNL